MIIMIKNTYQWVWFPNKNYEGKMTECIFFDNEKDMLESFMTK